MLYFLLPEIHPDSHEHKEILIVNPKNHVTLFILITPNPQQKK